MKQTWLYLLFIKLYNTYLIKLQKYHLNKNKLKIYSKIKLRTLITEEIYEQFIFIQSKLQQIQFATRQYFSNSPCKSLN